MGALPLYAYVASESIFLRYIPTFAFPKLLQTDIKLEKRAKIIDQWLCYYISVHFNVKIPR